MDKYYTPTIEEFHTGFEYEIFDKIGWIQFEFKDFDSVCLYKLLANGHKFSIKNAIQENT